MHEPRRILIYRIGQIGDMVVALPSLWVIRECFPRAYMALLSDAHPERHLVPASHVLPPTGLFDAWLCYSVGAPRKSARAVWQAFQDVRRLRCETLVYLAPRLCTASRVRRDLLFFRMAGVRRFIGHRGVGPLPPRLGSEPLPTLEHEADHLLGRLARDGVPVPPAGQGRMDLCLTVVELDVADAWLRSLPRREGAPFVGIGPGTKWPSKCWPEARYAMLGRELVTQLGVHPVIFGGPEDAALAARLIQEWGTGSSAAGVLTVRQAAAALRQCVLYVGNDTGTMHLAAAVGTPCVAVFSAQDWPGRWYPYGLGHTVLRRTVPCEGCRLSICTSYGLRCLREIDVDTVLGACAQRLAFGNSLTTHV